MCTRQPGLSEATTEQPVLAIASSFQSARRPATAGHSTLNLPPTPLQGIDGEGSEARGGRRHHRTLGISKALDEACIQFVAAFEVTGVGGYQPTTPLTLGKPNVEAGGPRQPLKGQRGLRKHAVDHAGGEDRQRLAFATGQGGPVPVWPGGELWSARQESAEGRAS